MAYYMPWLANVGGESLIVDIYVSQSGSGTQDGSSAANARSVSWLNTAGNWGGGAGQVGAGKVVQLVGTVTGNITLQGSGTSGNYITIDGGTSTYSGAFETNGKSWWNIQNISWSSATNTLFSISGGSNGIVQGCTADNLTSEAIFLNQNSGTQRPDTILIKNNWFRTATTNLGNVQCDMIITEGSTNVTVEGNYLEIRIGGSGSQAHDDIIQTYEKNGTSVGPPSNWTARYNWFVMNCSGWSADRSWFMWENLTGTNYIYRNVFLGIAGAEGANGLNINTAGSGATFNIFQNTFVCKNSASNNVLNLSSPGTFNVRGNIIHTVDQTCLTGSATVSRSYNQWYGTNIPSTGTNNEQSGDPLFTDYTNNDFSLQGGSPALNSGSNFGAPYDVTLADGATWPGPATGTPSGTWDRGAFE